MIRRYERAAAWARSATMAAMLATVTSGVGLLFVYRPSSGLPGRVLVLAHIVSIVVLAQGIIASGVIGLLGSPRPSETAKRVLNFVVALVAFLLSTATGILLGWDQVALVDVENSDVKGFGWIFGDEVRFVLVNDAVVGVDTMQRLLTVHLGSAIVVALAGLVAPRILSKWNARGVGEGWSGHDRTESTRRR